MYSGYVESCFIDFIKIEIINCFLFSPVMDIAIHICQKGMFDMELLILNFHSAQLFIVRYNIRILSVRQKALSTLLI